MMIVPIVCSIFLVVTRKKNSYPHDVQVPPLPPFDEAVKIMYGKQLDSFADEVVRAIYSKDKTMRFVLLKNGKRLYTYYWKPSTGLKRMNGDMNALRKILCPVCGKLYPGKITVLFSTVKSF
ncbi:MAG: hypothetical protein IKV54_04270 [Clostridia bacterium]|nr:hypothetical protein [Clostridia bacterium]